MGAYALALAILMWLWSSVSRVLVQQFAGKSSLSLRMAWLAVAIAVGIAALLAGTWMLLPDSYVSRGWTREELELAQQCSAMLVLATGAMGFAAGWLSLRPMPGSAAASCSKPAEG